MKFHKNLLSVGVKGQETGWGGRGLSTYRRLEIQWVSVRELTQQRVLICAHMENACVTIC